MGVCSSMVKKVPWKLPQNSDDTFRYNITAAGALMLECGTCSRIKDWVWKLKRWIVFTDWSRTLWPSAASRNINIERLQLWARASLAGWRGKLHTFSAKFCSKLNPTWSLLWIFLCIDWWSAVHGELPILTAMWGCDRVELVDFRENYKMQDFLAHWWVNFRLRTRGDYGISCIFWLCPSLLFPVHSMV